MTSTYDHAPIPLRTKRLCARKSSEKAWLQPSGERVFMTKRILKGEMSSSAFIVGFYAGTILSFDTGQP